MGEDVHPPPDVHSSIPAPHSRPVLDPGGSGHGLSVRPRPACVSSQHCPEPAPGPSVWERPPSQTEAMGLLKRPEPGATRPSTVWGKPRWQRGRSGPLQVGGWGAYAEVAKAEGGRGATEAVAHCGRSEEGSRS